jgi:CRP-like cAMP-binding protein
MAIPDLREFDIISLARRMGARFAYRPGDVIFREGDPADAMYVVLSGSVEVSTHGRVVEIIQRGDGLGILSLIDGRERGAQAIATTDAELALLDARRFRYMVEEVPYFCWYVMEALAQRLRATNAVV